MEAKEAEVAPATPCGVITRQDGTFISVCGTPSLPQVNVLTGVLSKAVFMCERHWEIQRKIDEGDKAAWLLSRERLERARERDRRDGIKAAFVAGSALVPAFLTAYYLPISLGPLVVPALSLIVGLIPWAVTEVLCCLVRARRGS